MTIEPLAAARVAGSVVLVAAALLAALWLRHRGAAPSQRLAALTALTLFLTFDLIVVGAYTRLSDSGLGCPDWPGCYGEASPIAAADDIQAAEAAMPSGPVTLRKAWVEMVHRYLAMVVGLLALILAVASWRWREALPHSAAWPIATLAWVIVQGLFGKYTVTWKLYPAIVTLHLLGGLLLLALLVVQRAGYQARPLPLAAGARRLALAFGAVILLQAALGAWVSSNYAVLACQGFPSCNGSWWPAMDFGHGFTLRRELGRAGHGGFLPFDALVAIHMAHRLFALAVLVVGAWLAARLMKDPDPSVRRHGAGVAGLLVLQVATGLSNVVLGWPLAAALMHTAGAAALVAVATSLIARGRVAVARPLPGRPAPLAGAA